MKTRHRTIYSSAIRGFAFSCLLSIGTASCATIKQASSTLGEIAEGVIDEMADDTTSDRREALRTAANHAVERKFGDTLSAEQKVQLAQQREAEMTCTATDFDEYFVNLFGTYAQVTYDHNGTGTGKVLEEWAKLETGVMLRVCGEFTERILSGEEPLHGTTTSEKLAGLIAKSDATWPAIRAEFPAFRAWIASMRDYR